MTQKSEFDINSLSKDQLDDNEDEEDEEDEEEEDENTNEEKITDKDNLSYKNNITDFHSLKVSKLKELALEKGLNVNGKKKNEIIALLSNE